MSFLLLYIVFTAATPGAGAPGQPGEKQKRRAGAYPTQRKKQMSLCNTNIKYVCTQNHPLQERLVWRIIFHAVRPFGRCVGVEVTCAGSRVLAHPGAAAFLFFKQSITQCAPLYKPFRQKSPKYRHGVAHGPGGGVRAPRPTDNMAAGEGGPSGTPAPTDALLVMRWGGPM